MPPARRTSCWALILAGALPAVLLAGAVDAKQPTAAAATAASDDGGVAPAGQRVVAHFRLAGEVPERPEPFSLRLSGPKALSMQGWLRRLAKARNDPKVAAVVLELADLKAGWAQVQEFRSAVGRLRAAGKRIYAYLAEPGLGNYLLAVACDRVVLPPAGHLDVSGLFGQVWFYKGLMDKLGLEADILQIGPYKGAGEPFTRTSPSEELKEELDRLMDDLFAQLVEIIAEGRSLPAEKVREWIDVGVFEPAEAVAAGLIDRAADLDELLSDLGTEYGAAVVSEFGTKAASKPDLASPFALFKIFSQAGARRSRGLPVIGLIYVDGFIVLAEDGETFGVSTVSPKDIAEAVEQALGDANVKAVVLRIDSPGGSALASDMIYRHIRRLAEQKPLVASMGNVAASGGYYVAAASPVILAEPATVTGSIGVVGGKLVLGGLLERIGITTYSLRRGAVAGTFDPTEPFTPAQRQRVQEIMAHIYRTFVERVLHMRRDKLTRPIDEVAGGRVFTGRQASKVGLVDRIGGLADAVRLAAERAGLEAYDIQIIPKPKSFVERLIEDIFKAADEEAVLLREVLGGLLSRRIDSAPARVRRALGRAILRARLLGGESILTVLPYDITLGP